MLKTFTHPKQGLGILAWRKLAHSSHVWVWWWFSAELFNFAQKLAAEINWCYRHFINHVTSYSTCVWVLRWCFSDWALVNPASQYSQTWGRASLWCARCCWKNTIELLNYKFKIQIITRFITSWQTHYIEKISKIRRVSKVTVWRQILSHLKSSYEHAVRSLPQPITATVI